MEILDPRGVEPIAIQSFKDRVTAAVFDGKCPKGFPESIFKVARRKLAYLDAASTLTDLVVPAGNKLHALRSDRDGQHAIWINDQFRICFVWTPAGPENVEIVDYH